jgi:uncharacterized membrane protein YkvA (DUF1232 family)
MLNRLNTNIFSAEFWRSVWRDLRLGWELFRDPRVPKRLKIIPMGVIIYLISPLDFISLIPVIGQLDDLAILILGVRWFIRLVPSAIVEEHRSKLP